MISTGYGFKVDQYDDATLSELENTSALKNSNRNTKSTPPKTEITYDTVHLMAGAEEQESDPQLHFFGTLHENNDDNDSAATNTKKKKKKGAYFKRRTKANQASSEIPKMVVTDLDGISGDEKDSYVVDYWDGENSISSSSENPFNMLRTNINSEDSENSIVSSLTDSYQVRSKSTPPRSSQSNIRSSSSSMPRVSSLPSTSSLSKIPEEKPFDNSSFLPSLPVSKKKNRKFSNIFQKKK